MVDNNSGDFQPGTASTSTVSLSQALLAPLDAIFKAQLHSARSFLSYLLQLGYPHRPVDEKGMTIPDHGKHYNLEFCYESEVDGKTKIRKVSIPALALVPVSPLAIESAEFKLAMNVERIDYHSQMQESEKETLAEDIGYGETKRPWYLVSEPVSVRGHIAPVSTGDGGAKAQQSSSIQIEVKVGRVPMPAGLDKLLTSLTQSTHVTEEEGTQPLQSSSPDLD